MVRNCGSEGTEVYSDDVGAWLDPYNSFVLSYIDELLEELHEMGFSEVILAHLSHPETTKKLVYSTAMTGESTPVGAVSSLAVRLGEDAQAMGLTLSVLLEEGTLTGNAEQTGQDQELFYRVFDRLCVPTDEETIDDLRSEAETALGRQDAFRRFVPVVTEAPSAGSWIINLY